LIATGNSSLLPPLPDLDDPAAQQEAQQACLQLARHLYPAGPSQAAAGPSTSNQAAVAPQLQSTLVDMPGYSPLLANLLADASALFPAPGQPGTSHATAAAAAAASGASSPEPHQPQQQHKLAPDYQAVLQLWQGDVHGMLASAIKLGALTADTVALSSQAGRATWEAAAKLHALQQQVAGQPHSAALQLLALGDVQGAAQVYQAAGLQQDAEALLQGWGQQKES
jgi:hypothetical protein